MSDAEQSEIERDIEEAFRKFGHPPPEKGESMTSVMKKIRSLLAELAEEREKWLNGSSGNGR